MKTILLLLLMSLGSIASAQINLGGAMDETAPLITAQQTLINPGSGFCRFIPSANYDMSVTPASVSFNYYPSFMEGVITISEGAAISVHLGFGETQYIEFIGLGEQVELSIITAGTLPVEISSFAGAAHGASVDLEWTTSTETNNYGFEIERKTVSVSNWEKIGFINGHGTTNAPQSYTFTDKSVSAKPVYRLKQIDRDGKFEYSKEVEVTVVAVPNVFSLSQNYPNPFNPATVINYSIGSPGHVALKVYDMLGKEVAELVNGQKEPGNYTAMFEASHLPSGVYFYRLDAGVYSNMKRFTLVK